MFALSEELYIVGEIGFGMLLPLFILLLPVTREDRFFQCFASFLIIVGVFLMRYSVVFIGFDIPLS
jgi:formate-dependent nitrite reductase membrane component NrfD